MIESAKNQITENNIYVCPHTLQRWADRESNSLNDRVCLNSFFFIYFCFILFSSVLPSDGVNVYVLSHRNVQRKTEKLFETFYAYRCTQQNFRRRRLLCVNNTRFGLCATATYYH